MTTKKHTINTKEEKGDWEASFFQRGSWKHQIKEQCIKADCMTGSFDPFMINQLINPKKSREEELLDKKSRGDKLNKTENMLIDIYIKKQADRIADDIDKINKLGLNARPETDEGRIRLLFKVAEYQKEKGTFDMLYYTFNKINEFKIPVHLLELYDEQIKEIESIIKKLNCIELQFTKFHSNMPPLNQRGFINLDPFQIEVIQHIDLKNSIIVQAPTSAGKSILTGYLYTQPNIKVLVVVPTDPLAWQMASMIGKITKKDIPLITRTFQSEITRNELIQRIETCGIVVGTPEYLVDYLPFIKIKFDWLVVDEIHMIGKDSCKEMEVIIKVFNEIPIMALSATIGNIELLQQWFTNHGRINTHIIKCDKRFFNLQRFYYDPEAEEEIIRIHPFSTVSIEDFKTGNILKRSLYPTPPDIWDLAIKIDKILPSNLKILNYFKQEQRITLDEANEYFMNILKWMVDNFDKKFTLIEKIIKYYQDDDLDKYEYDLYELAMVLKKKDKLPGLVFQTDSHLCLEYVRKFSRKIRDEEEKAYPNLMKERIKQQSRVRAAEKKIEQMKFDGMGEKQITKLLMEGTLDKMQEATTDVAIFEPHPDFTITPNISITHYMIDQWNKELKYYFPQNGSEYHYIIDLLWRGVGVYCKGLPDAYLHIVQNLACSGKLGLVFSDESLVFGVSMPFRTSIITYDENINSMMYHQMAGRAGRRGLDKEGNVMLLGYNWTQIKELTTSVIPDVIGCDTMFYGACFASKLHDEGWNNIKYKFETPIRESGSFFI
jgi:superfamily II RNA helicase